MVLPKSRTSVQLGLLLGQSGDGGGGGGGGDWFSHCLDECVFLTIFYKYIIQQYLPVAAPPPHFQVGQILRRSPLVAVN